MTVHSSTPTRNEIRQRVHQHLPELTRRYGVIQLGLFGSYQRGEQTSSSDVDLLIEIDNPALTLLEFVELRDYLSDLLGVNVDLVEKATLKPTLASRILAEVELL